MSLLNDLHNLQLAIQVNHGSIVMIIMLVVDIEQLFSAQQDPYIITFHIQAHGHECDLGGKSRGRTNTGLGDHLSVDSSRRSRLWGKAPSSSKRVSTSVNNFAYAHSCKIHVWKPF
jgi:hypothetical protein